MGLDTVELVMTIEESFDIQIPDVHAEKMRTVGDVYDYILAAKQANQTQRGACLTAATFYKIRRELCPLLDVAPNSLRPRTDITTVIPASQRRWIWQELRQRLHVLMPPLNRPVWCLTVLPLLVMIVSVAAGFIAIDRLGTCVATTIVMLTLSVAGTAAAWMTTPLAVHPAENIRTLGGLSTVVLAYNQAAISTETGSWDKGEIWEALRVIIADQVGVPIEHVVREASFVDDFGV